MRTFATLDARRDAVRRLALVLSASAVFGCQNEASRTTTAIDPTIPTAAPSMPPFGDGVPRMVGAIRHDGIESSLVLDEVMITAESASALEEFMSRHGGALLLTIAPPDDVEGETRYLLRVDTGGIDTGGLVDDLEELSDVRGGLLEATSEAVLRLLALAARESLNGVEVTLNWVMLGDDISNRTTEEAPWQSGFRDAFDEDYFKTGTAQDIGIGEAWVALERAGKLSNKVKLAVIDGGFIDDPDIDFNVMARSFIPGAPALDVPGRDALRRPALRGARPGAGLSGARPVAAGAASRLRLTPGAARSMGSNRRPNERNGLAYSGPDAVPGEIHHVQHP